MDELRESMLDTLTVGCDPREMGPWGEARAEAEAMLAEYERALSEKVWDEGHAARPGVVVVETEYGPIIQNEAPNPYRITEENN